MVHLNRLDFCCVEVGQVKIELPLFVTVRAMLLYEVLSDRQQPLHCNCA